MYQWTHPFAIRGPGILAKISSALAIRLNNSAPQLHVMHAHVASFCYFQITLNFNCCNDFPRRSFSPFRPCCTHSLTHPDIMLYFFMNGTEQGWLRHRTVCSCVSPEILLGLNTMQSRVKKGKEKGASGWEDGEETRDGGRGPIRKGKEERRGEDEGERARERKKSHFIHKVWL